MNTYPNLSQNGKIFPSWILYKFNKYLIKTDPTDDPCNPKLNKRQLRPYQEFISKYIDYNSPYNSILLYHGVGSGKTATAIEVYNNLYRHSEYWNVIIMIKASLRGDWERELNTWLMMDEQEKNNERANIHFLTYNSSNAWQHFQELQKQLDTTKKNLYIIDEVHNFIRTVYNSVVSLKAGGCHQIYDALIREKQDNPSTRIITISATPGINYPFEFGLLFNLLRPGAFPEKESDFNNLFLTYDKTKNINDFETKINMTKDKVNMFQRRILGLVSYYDSADPKAFAKKNIYNINIKLTDYQKTIYNIFADIEAKAAAKYPNRKNKNKLFKVYTRNACDFVFPSVNGIDGTNRPRPSKFQISEKEADEIMKAKENVELGEKYAANINKEKYLLTLKKYIDTFKDYCDELNDKDIKSKHTILDDFKNLIDEFKDTKKPVNKIIEEYIINNKASKLLQQLYTCSPKYTCMMLYVYTSPGPVILYTAYVRMEGIEVLKVYLSCFGYKQFDTKKIDKKDDYHRFIEYDGLIDAKLRVDYQKAFNNDSNKYGKDIKVILLSQAGSEGITLLNIRQIHIAEPHWNEALMQQVIGRGVRRCSHKSLPPEERIVDVYRYKMTFEDLEHPDKKTTDEYIESVANNKEFIINKFLTAIKEAAVDCELNKENNIINNKDLKCFKFEESALLTDKIYPAYQENLEDDQLVNSGLNAINNEVINEKVYKINAIILKDKEKQIYSESNEYWLNKTTGAVYNYKYKFLVGRLKYYTFNNQMIFEQNDDDDFIIDYLTPYPGLLKDKNK